MRTALDDTPEYKESVRAAIAGRVPTEVAAGLDEHALDLASCYLWWNGYKDDGDRPEGPLYADTPGTTPGQTAHFVYDVLKWTEENT